MITIYFFNLRFTNIAAEKNEHPQKYFVKMICDILFYCGAGDFWYEDRNLTNLQQYMYNIYAIIINVYLVGNLINEFLANLRSDLTSKEKNDLTQFLLGHTVVFCKVTLLYVMKKKIKILSKRFFEEKRDFAILDFDKESVKKAKKFCAIIIITVYLTLCMAAVDAIRRHLSQGVPIRTEIVFYPTPSHSGLLINILRFVVELHWWYGVTLMISIDCMCISFLVFIGHKFRTLKTYFEALRQKYQEDSEKDLEVLEGKYIKDFERGILFHKEILW